MQLNWMAANRCKHWEKMEARVGIEPAYTELQSRAFRVIFYTIINNLLIYLHANYRSLRSFRVL
jgi:hypothetical protein